MSHYGPSLEELLADDKKEAKRIRSKLAKMNNTILVDSFKNLLGNLILVEKDAALTNLDRYRLNNAIEAVKTLYKK